MQIKMRHLKALHPYIIVDYRCEDRNKVKELTGEISAIRKVLTPCYKKKPQSPPHKKKRTVQSGDTFEDTAFKPRFESVKF
jgi:hypothetical protein